LEDDLTTPERITAALGRPPERIAILRALQLGDLLCAVPAWRALRAAFPAAVITLIGLPWARAFVERFAHLLDRFVEFPGYPGLPERAVDLRAVPPFLERLQAEPFDLVLQMHGSGSLVNPLMMLFGAERAAGFYEPGRFCPDPDLFIPYPDGVHEIRRHLALMAHLGLPPRGEHLEFPLTAADRAELEALGLGLRPGRYVVVHPGARAAERRWPPRHFARLADEAARAGYAVALTGTAEERPLTAAVAAAMRGPAVDLAGATRLGAAAALIQRARLLIANDTGVSHVAAALGTPSLIVATHAEHERWAPLDARRHRVFAWTRDPRLDAVLALLARCLGGGQPERRLAAEVAEAARP
jgi:ADP-heptose:LPS heptosyltransferase